MSNEEDTEQRVQEVEMSDHLSIVTRERVTTDVDTGHATGPEGTPGRQGDYENLKLKGSLTSQDVRSEHLEMALHPANDWPVKPLLLVEPSEVSLVVLPRVEASRHKEECNKARTMIKT